MQRRIIGHLPKPEAPTTLGLYEKGGYTLNALSSPYPDDVSYLSSDDSDSSSEGEDGKDGKGVDKKSVHIYQNKHYHGPFILLAISCKYFHELVLKETQDRNILRRCYSSYHGEFYKAVLEMRRTCKLFTKRYLDLVWYARAEKNYSPGAPQRPALVRIDNDESLEEDLAKICNGDADQDWHHGFNSGCLATSRLFFGLSSTSKDDVFRDPETEGDSDGLDEFGDLIDDDYDQEFAKEPEGLQARKNRERAKWSFRIHQERQRARDDFPLLDT